jgi:hypothetical protein
MKRLIILTLISILFSSAINVLLVVNILSLNHQVIDITNNTKDIVTNTNKVLNTSLANQRIIMENQHNNAETFRELFANQTRDILATMSNKTSEIMGK